MSVAEAREAKTWRLRKFGVLKTASTSSPMNSSRVPSRSSMTSAICPRTVVSKLNTSVGARPLQASSKPSMSQKRILTSHFATPISASMPSLKSRCTTQGGTYIDQDLMARHMDTKAFCSWFNSSTSLTSPVCMSLSTWRTSKEDSAFMSSTRERSGVTSIPVTCWILAFCAHAKKHSKTTVHSIVSNAKTWNSRTCADTSVRYMLLLTPAVQPAGQHAWCTWPLARPALRMISFARTKGSDCASGTPTGKQWPLSK
mmetsp:Transcript_13468/g.31628  ORF Transcript_13468/g.31628 Transcript_13468/m.31628 type:complete len:257 (+) Transcript_13468:922-1692(+)